MDFETQRIFGVLLGYAFFRHDGTEDDIVHRHNESASDSFAAAACDSRTFSCFSSSYTVTSRLESSFTPSGLRAPSVRFRFSPLSTTSTVFVTASLWSARRTAFDFGASKA